MSNTSKIITAVIILVSIGVAWLLFTNQSKKSLTEQLSNEQLRNEALLSEKLLVEEALEKNKQKIESLAVKNTDLNDLLNEKTEVWSTQTRENLRIKKALQLARKQQEEAKALNDTLRDQLRSELEIHSSLTQQNKSLKDSVNSLVDQNAYLQDEINKEILRSVDETLVLGLKRNNRKITAKAARTKKLVAQVEVPRILDNMHFIVEGPEGEVISDDKDNRITSRVLENSQNATASMRGEAGIPDTQSKKIEISYTPEDKLKPGTYTFKIFNNDTYVGSMKAKLE